MRARDPTLVPCRNRSIARNSGWCSGRAIGYERRQMLDSTRRTSDVRSDRRGPFSGSEYSTSDTGFFPALNEAMSTCLRNSGLHRNIRHLGEKHLMAVVVALAHHADSNRAATLPTMLIASAPVTTP